MTRADRCATRLCAIAAIALGALVWTASPSGGQTVACAVSTSDQGVDIEEQHLLGLLNGYRQENGKNALAMEPSVTQAAAWFSRDMATKDYFAYDHVDSHGRTIPQRLTWCGVSYSNWAENIYAGSPDAQSVFDAWTASSSHNTNMLRDGITTAGIARAYSAGSTYGWYWTLDFTNTAGSTTTTSAPPAATTTTTTRPTAGPALGTLEWYALQYPQYFGTTPATPPPTTSTTAPVSTSTTTTRPPATTSTTQPPATTEPPPATGPGPGTPEWWRQFFASYYPGM